MAGSIFPLLVCRDSRTRSETVVGVPAADLRVCDLVAADLLPIAADTKWLASAGERQPSFDYRQPAAEREVQLTEWRELILDQTLRAFAAAKLPLATLPKRNPGKGVDF